MKPILCTMILTSVLSCSQSTNEVQNNNEPRSEVIVIDTGDFYVYREYFPNDTLSLEVGMKDDQITGFRKSYYSNGSSKEIVKIKGFYPTDYCCPNGLYKVFYENGVLKEIHNKENGEYEGRVISFDTLGNKKAEFQVLQGLRHGMAKRYYPNGMVKGVYEYKQDTLTKTAYTFTEKGDSLKRYFLKKGKISFPITYWKEDGRSLTGEYYNNQNFKVKWTWRDSSRNTVKSEIVDTVNGQFITPLF